MIFLVIGFILIKLSLVLKFFECWDFCGVILVCLVFLYDENVFICFIFENIDDVVNVIKN